MGPKVPYNWAVSTFCANAVSDKEPGSRLAQLQGEQYPSIAKRELSALIQEERLLPLPLSILVWLRCAGA